MTEVLNFYKTDEWTAVILTDESGIVLDVQIIFKPTSEFSQRTAQRRKHYKQRPRVELPEDLRGKTEVGAWLS
jgi:hypothetical protein